MIHTPAYIGFTNVLTENGYNIVHSDLIKDENNVWRMDFTDMEEKIKKEHIHVLIFCSPHNPSGRVWEKWEIEKLMEICKKYDVYVIADEIWSDIILTGNKHIPTQAVSEDAKNRTVAFYATTKTFNLAGMVGSYSIIYNDYLSDRVKKEASLSCYNSINILSMYALIGAYKPQGEEWLDELCQVITENVEYACSYVEKNFDGVNVAKPQGTYMLFMDCEKWCEEHGVTMDELLLRGAQVGVIWQDGRPFFGKNHIRLNLALPKVRVEEAMRRLKEYVFI